MRNISINSNDRLFDFVNALERHIREHSDFFNINLLDIFTQYYGYMDIGISSYSNGKFLGCIGKNKAKDLIDIYLNQFHNHDTLSEYITSQTSSPAQSITNAKSVYLPTDFIPKSQYAYSEYYKYLCSAGLYNIAVMAFSDYRICFFKDSPEKDFTDDEVQSLSHLYHILYEKLITFHVDLNTRISNQLQQKFWSNKKMGFIIYDEYGIALEYNDCVLEYITSLFPYCSLTSVFKYLIADFQNVNKGVINKTITGRNYKISICSSLKVDSFGIVRTHYLFTISKTNNESCTATFINNSYSKNIFSSLTMREVEILDAYCNGNDYHQIAKSLIISEHTVRSHLKNIYQKLGTSNQRVVTKLYFEYLYSNQCFGDM